MNASPFSLKTSPYRSILKLKTYSLYSLRRDQNLQVRTKATLQAPAKLVLLNEGDQNMSFKLIVIMHNNSLKSFAIVLLI